MLLAFAFSLIPFVLRVVARQVPIVNDVLGGTEGSPRSVLKLSSTVTSVNTPGKLRIKSENSGICEATPGVYQATGYGDISNTESIWFWYFAARNNPDTAPLTLWLNGGPGSSSMIGLFQELGPCRINNDSTTISPNPFSWNTHSNVLFVDQPFGVGFSLSATSQSIGTSQDAAAALWKFLQIFLADDKFKALATRDFALWAESYGGHYGPVFSHYFLSQNAAIEAGTITGIPLKLKVLGLGDGLTDALAQYPGYIAYAASNPYHPLVPATTLASSNTSWTSTGGCRDQITACYNGGNDTICSQAQSYCNARVLSPLYGNYDPYYVPSLDNATDSSYPADITNYLISIRATIGAEKVWAETNIAVYLTFASTGDWMRNTRQDLEAVIDAGVRTIVFVGDADYICNYVGMEAMVDALSTQFTSLYSTKTFQDYTVNGKLAGQYKTAGTLSYLRLYAAGHEAPAYKYGALDYGEATFQMFNQMMSNESIVAT